MNHILQPNATFDFATISLSHPTLVNGGAYFTKILVDKRSLYIEAPKCLTKQGFIKNGKKMWCELMFTNNDEEFIHWMENLEANCQKLIYSKKESWFQNELEMDDIETAFTAPLRVYKSGKFYLLRVNLKMNYTTNLPVIKIYNEYETPLTTDDIKVDTQMISIIEIQGIKFTSKSFQIEMEMKQVMIMNSDEIFENCLIKSNIPANMKKSLEERKDMSHLERLEQMADIIMTENNDDSEEGDSGVAIAKPTINMPVVPVVPMQVQDDNKLMVEIKKQTEYEIDNKQSPIDELEEFNVSASLENLETITLKKPNQVYYEIYKIAREKAKKAKKEAILAFLEAKNIKKTYMLDDLDESDCESDDSYDNYENYENDDDDDETDRTGENMDLKK